MEFNFLPDKVEFLPRYIMHQNSYPIKSILLSQNSFYNINFNISIFINPGDDKIFVNGFPLQDSNGLDELAEVSRILYYDVIPQKYKFESLRIIQIKEILFIIKKWTKTESVSFKKERETRDKLEFIPFDSHSSDIFCLIPYEIGYHRNYVSEIIFNLNHPSSIILKRAIDIYQEKRHQLNKLIQESLDFQFNSNPLIKMSYMDYNGDFLQQGIAEWTIKFCAIIEQNHLFLLTNEERSQLQLPLNIKTCYQ